jgi:DNA-binding HxlR family transcriptional regulator
MTDWKRKIRWNAYAAECPTRQLLDRVTDKWVVLVLGLLEPGPQRFNALRRQIEGISQKMLTQTLRNLEADGFVMRRVFPTVPVTVECQLTPVGRGLNSVLNPIREWAETNMSRVQKIRGEIRHR